MNPCPGGEPFRKEGVIPFSLPLPLLARSPLTSGTQRVCGQLTFSLSSDRERLSMLRHERICSCSSSEKGWDRLFRNSSAERRRGWLSTGSGWPVWVSGRLDCRSGPPGAGAQALGEVRACAQGPGGRSHGCPYPFPAAAAPVQGA